MPAVGRLWPSEDEDEGNLHHHKNDDADDRRKLSQ